MSTSSDNNALDVLMNNARSNSSRKRPLTFFACPAGCGASVTTMNVNLHLDRCLGNLSDDKKSASIDYPQYEKTQAEVYWMLKQDNQPILQIMMMMTMNRQRNENDLYVQMQ